MNDLCFMPSEIDKSSIMKLEDFSKRNRLQKPYVYTLRAERLQTRRNWTEHIMKRLQEQLNTEKGT